RPIIMSSLNILSALGAAELAIALADTAALSKRISRPISKLSEFTHKLAESNFSPELSLEKTLKKSEIGTSDVFSLAENISLMQKKLGEYISNLERESRARELAETELKIAGKIQAEFLPGKEYESAGVEICANMRPARQAAGDLYDYFPLDDGRLSMSVGDVSGKGIAAALFMAKADTILRASANLEKSLPKMASRINAALCANNDSCMFLTLFMCAFNFETRELGYVCCGHNPPIVKRANGETFFLKCRPNIALGLDENAEFARETVFLERGDTLFIYTDGATEAESKNGEFFGEERLLNCVKNAPGSPREICESVLRDLDAFALGAEQSDDITILSAKIK
ncbi:MAG: SpoIIE family protein phosphatase, partial [Opitutales bacterium]|nr:SpoIIE family protein phosphatase [Opitutales bacterium]